MPTLSIGVTGHRLARLGDVDVPALCAEASALLEAIGAAAGVGTHCRMISGLAEGADSIIADAALAHGWQLDVVLPFGRDEFARDFPEGEALDGYRRRLDRAHAVFELPGDRDEPDGNGAAYERAGRVVLAQSDILLAIWDSAPAQGRGGAAQIVTEAVIEGIPVLHIDPHGREPAALLWGGLEAHDLGRHSVETVPRGALDRLPELVRRQLELPDDAGERQMLTRFGDGQRRRRASFAWVYPMLLTVMGVGKRPAPAVARCGNRPCQGFDAVLAARVDPVFAHADAEAGHASELFRSAYVSNFALAAIAVLLSLMGLALPSWMKPFLAAAEVATIAAILAITRVGNRSNWHRRWLDNRQLAERLRCLSTSARLGELALRADAGGAKSWVGWYVRATARATGLPDAAVNRHYLARVREELIALVEGQIAYLGGDAHRMHRLDHRLHLLGTILFATTALVCVALLVFKATSNLVPGGMPDDVSHPIAVGATIISAALPAVGAAIYGIRMQGDFAGIAERSEALGHHLAALRTAMGDDGDSDYDTLLRRTRRATDLLTEELSSWLQTYQARPLSLPG